MSAVNQAGPERIWAGSPSMCGNAFGDWDTVKGHDGDVEYIRADLAAPSAPAEVEGLVERLRDNATLDECEGCNPDVVALEREAAATLTALQAENERLRASRFEVVTERNAIACSPATLKRYFRAELQERLMARDQLDLRRFELVMEQANAGNVGAIKELGRMMERNDSLLAGRRFDDAQSRKAEPKSKPMGKKEAAQHAAETAGGEDSLWGNDLTPGFARPN